MSPEKSGRSLLAFAVIAALTQCPPLPGVPGLVSADSLSGALQFLLNTPSPAPGSSP